MSLLGWCRVFESLSDDRNHYDASNICSPTISLIIIYKEAFNKNKNEQNAT